MNMWTKKRQDRGKSKEAVIALLVENQDLLCQVL